MSQYPESNLLSPQSRRIMRMTRSAWAKAGALHLQMVAVDPGKRSASLGCGPLRALCHVSTFREPASVRVMASYNLTCLEVRRRQATDRGLVPTSWLLASVTAVAQAQIVLSRPRNPMQGLSGNGMLFSRGEPIDQSLSCLMANVQCRHGLRPSSCLVR